MSSKAKVDEQLAQCTCLRLRQLTRRVTQLYDQLLAPAGLTINQFGILAYLSGHADVSIGELADRLLMDPTSLTRTLRPLETRRLIKVTTGKDDRRRRTLMLTDAGRAAFHGAAPLWRKAQAAFAEMMGTRSFDVLDRSLDLSLQQLMRI